MTSITWTLAGGGDWSDAAAWSTGTVPGPADSVSITGVTVTDEAAIAAQSVALNQAGLTIGNGVQAGPSLSTFLSLEDSTLTLETGLFSGTVASDGGTLVVQAYDNILGESAFGTFQTVTWQGELHPVFNNIPGSAYFPETGTLTVLGGLTLAGDGGSGPGTLVLDQEGGLNFVGQQSLDNATVALGGAASFEAGYEPYLETTASGGTAPTLSLGSHLSLSADGAAYITNTGLILSAATISTTGSANLAVNGGVFGSAGTIDVNELGTLSFIGNAFVNQGSILVAQGGVLTINNASGGNGSGTLVDHGNVVLGGTLTTANLASLHLTASQGGLVDLTGTLNNVGATLSLGAGGALPALTLQGVIDGGTVAGAGGLVVADGALDNVTVAGALTINPGEYLDANGLAFTGAANVSVLGGALSFGGAETIAAGTLRFSSLGGGLRESGGTLTLGTGVQTDFYGGTASLYAAGAAIVNDGTLSLSGGTSLTVSGTILNNGVFSISAGSTLNLENGTLSGSNATTITKSTLLFENATDAQLAALHLSGCTLNVLQTLSLGGGTLAIGGQTGVSELAVGQAITGGTIVNEGAAVFLLGDVTLSQLTYRGLLTANGEVTLQQVIVQNQAGNGPGTIAVSGGLDVAPATPGQAALLNAATIDLGSASGPPRIGGNTPLLDLGSRLTINETAKFGAIGENSAFATSVTNSGAINSTFAGGTLTLDGAIFMNAGTITAASATALSDAALLRNTGTIAIGTGGALELNLTKYYQALPAAGTSFVNDGAVSLAGGTLAEQPAAGLPVVALENGAGGTISGFGSIAAQIDNHGTIAASGGSLTDNQAISGVGTLLVSANDTLSLLARVSAGQTALFGGSDGVLGLSPKLFLGQIGGFASGETIDLLKTAASAASFSGSSIAITLTAGGTLTLHTTSALTGALSTTTDGHDGTLISFAGAVAHAANVPDPAWSPDTAVAAAPPAWHQLASELLTLPMQHAW